MVKVKEFKGDVKHPDVEEAMNNFFESLPEDFSIYNIMYSNALLPNKDKEGKITYIIVSTALLFYDDGLDE